MLQPPPIEKIPGFDVQIMPRDINLAGVEGNQGEHLLENWHWRVDIVCDGSNTHWPNPFQETMYVARLSRTNDIPEPELEVPTIILGADDSPLSIALEQLAIENTLGLWLTIVCDTPVVVLGQEAEFHHMMFIEELPAVAGMQMN